MQVCPECASTLCVTLTDPGEQPAFVRCMLCETLFLGGEGRETPPLSLGGRTGDGGHQVKVRVTATDLRDDPLRIAKAWAREVACSGAPVPVGVGAIAAQPSGNTEVTLLLMIPGVNTSSSAQEEARRRCAALARLDPRVRDVRPVAATPLSPGAYSRIPESVSPRA